MRHSQSEKLEIIRTVENSSAGVKRTLAELGINRSTFYNWYSRYTEGGYDALASRPPRLILNTLNFGTLNQVHLS